MHAIVGHEVKRTAEYSQIGWMTIAGRIYVFHKTSLADNALHPRIDHARAIIPGFQFSVVGAFSIHSVHHCTGGSHSRLDRDNKPLTHGIVQDVGFSILGPALEDHRAVVGSAGNGGGKANIVMGTERSNN